MFDPVNPFDLTTEELRERARWAYEMLDMGVRQPAPPEGYFRCTLCQRVLRKIRSDAEAHAEFFRRFPGEELDADVVMCSACNFIVSLTMGISPE